MSNDAAVPTAEDKARYEQLKKDLMQALHKKRAADKALVWETDLQVSGADLGLGIMYVGSNRDSDLHHGGYIPHRDLSSERW